MVNLYKYWCNLDENIYIAETDQQYKQYAGLNFNINILKKLSFLRMENTQLFLNEYCSEDTPKSLITNILETYANSYAKNLEINLHITRNKKIMTKKHKFKDKYVNWSNWRQFNNSESISNFRKEVFDEFIIKTNQIAPYIDLRFKKISNVYEKFSRKNQFFEHLNLDPLNGYLFDEKFSYNQLYQFVQRLGLKARKPFIEKLDLFSNLILNRPAEYHDDFYFFRNKIFADYENIFHKINPIVEVKKIIKSMNFNLSRISFDNVDRPNKYPSPICFFVKIPTDIRILYKSENPYFDIQSCFHESGHAIHASSIAPDIDYWNKYFLPMGVAEIFSILMERLTKNPIYLKSILSTTKIDNVFFEKLQQRTNFMELFFVTFYAANSLMKMEFWKQHLSIKETNSLYNKLVKKFTNIDLPGEYWMLHHILPESVMYVPSYLIAAVRAKELETILVSKFGDTWWSDKNSGKYLKNLMNDGAEIDLTFSKLNTVAFIDEITNN